ncbi:hypothetical protein PR202_gb11592 [Eleusine coracana subsp. coracana]|uniref:Uncharacterized protein n=1 Tax=Eleusine coracana subsp. coracana TaxID=191504 RepID=A0AAV5EMM3_ELECO|nr:hypothetical protein PR202_gb11592 [Eleusine coracana subsp. coracana]
MTRGDEGSSGIPYDESSKPRQEADARCRCCGSWNGSSLTTWWPTCSPESRLAASPLPAVSAGRGVGSSTSDTCLRAELLPHTLAGLFINYKELQYSELFARPSWVDYYLSSSSRVVDHCNGLLLQDGCVLNPATGEWAPLPEQYPPPRAGMEHFLQDTYLVFDPAVSSHFEVFLIPSVPRGYAHDHQLVDSAMLQSEWPPSPCILSVFSSTTGQWEERSFIRQGQAAGTVADMQLDKRWLQRPRQAVYLLGELISISNSNYRVIKPPKGIEMLCECAELHLGRSKKGIYFALLDDQDILRVWVLYESACGQMEWMLNHVSGQGLVLDSLKCQQHVNGPWILDNANSGDDRDDNEQLVEQDFEWNSDDDESIITHVEDVVTKQFHEYLQILGFHPYKEIIFLNRSLSRGLAYHLSTSKLEDLGNLCPKDYRYISGPGCPRPQRPAPCQAKKAVMDLACGWPPRCSATVSWKPPSSPTFVPCSMAGQRHYRTSHPNVVL